VQLSNRFLLMIRS